MALMVKALLVLGVFVVAWLVSRSPLNSIPGPFLAKFSDIWRLIDVWKGRSDVTQRRLHERYGSAVRLGPNCVSLSDPSIIKTIYSSRNPFKKSEFYSAGDVVTQGKRVQSQFTTRNEDWHNYLVRPIKTAYSLSSVLKFEPRVDATLDYFVEKLKREYATTNGVKSCPIGDLLHHFAWDVIGEVTFSERLGVLDGNPEAMQPLKDAAKAMHYFGIIGQMPWLDRVMKNPIYSFGPQGFKFASDFASKRLEERLQSEESFEHEDFLNLFIEVEKNKEEGGEGSQLTRRQISWLVLNVAAGSDTTASTLRAAFYFISHNEAIKQKLVNELSNACDQDKSLDWKKCQSLSYLDAVVKETLRLSPAIGLLLERVVPPKGLSLPDGGFIPGGTIVGISPCVINHNKEVFGPSAGEFLPERWLKNDDEQKSDYESRLSRMREADLTFGAGRRSCIGRNLAILEVYKCIARLFWEFNVRALLELKLLP